VKHLGLIGAILPLVLLAIGLIGWVLSVRNDVSDAVTELTSVQAEISNIHERMDTERSVHALITDELSDQISNIETSLAVANDQMQTIMGDHLGFADVLREMGESTALPSGERRNYGGY